MSLQRSGGWRAANQPLWDCEINEVSLVSLSENTELIAIPRAGRVQSHVKWKQGRMRNCLGEPHSVAVADED
jgi:hypothetical protein